MTSKLSTSQEEHIRPSAVWTSEGASEYNEDDMARADEEFNEEQGEEYVEYEMQENTDDVQNPNQDDMARADEEFNEEQKEEYVECEMHEKTDAVQHPSQKYRSSTVYSVSLYTHYKKKLCTTHGRLGSQSFKEHK